MKHGAGLALSTFYEWGGRRALCGTDRVTKSRDLVHEIGGKFVALLCHHNLEADLHAYLDGLGLASDAQGLLFCTVGWGGTRAHASMLFIPPIGLQAALRSRLSPG